MDNHLVNKEALKAMREKFQLHIMLIQQFINKPKEDPETEVAQRTILGPGEFYGSIEWKQFQQYVELPNDFDPNRVNADGSYMHQGLKDKILNNAVKEVEPPIDMILWAQVLEIKVVKNEIRQELLSLTNDNQEV